MSVKQLTWSQSEEIAEQAAERALGFGPFDGPVPKELTVKDILRVAKRAAAIALKHAGCLRDHDAADARRFARLADQATREHRAWCNRTGSTH